MTDKKRCVIAFSGGLDTSLCAVYLREEFGYEIVTATIDTGGFPPEELEYIEQRSKELGAVAHYTVDGIGELFDGWIRHIIAANFRKGGVYPLSVGVERVVQAQHLARIAREQGATAVCHGSTGAGNDQIRFDVVLRTVAPELTIHTPIRDLGWNRIQEAEYLQSKGFDVDASTKDYSINAGLWGTTIGGKETLRSDGRVPDHIFPATKNVNDTPEEAQDITIHFEKGVPTALDGESMDPVSLLRKLDVIAAGHGVGRDVHLGDTIIGIKGRVAFEAPAAQVVIEAHRELEKLTLTKWQSFVKEQVGQFYGMFLHEGRYLDPALRDIEAFLDSSQKCVTGDVEITLHRGSSKVRGVSSPHSLMAASKADYGEQTGLWDGRDAEGFARIAAIQSMLANRASGGDL
ncbi:MAG: argininosuccinate synthase [Bradymonadia bacterium]|jgi:argininosuccinate synthase